MYAILYNKTIEEIIKTNLTNNIEIQSVRIKSSIMKQLKSKNNPLNQQPCIHYK